MNFDLTMNIGRNQKGGSLQLLPDFLEKTEGAVKKRMDIAA